MTLHIMTAVAIIFRSHQAAVFAKGVRKERLRPSVHIFHVDGFQPYTSCNEKQYELRQCFYALRHQSSTICL